MIAKYVGAGLICTLALMITASGVIRPHYTAGIVIILLAIIMFLILTKLAQIADNALDGAQKIIDAADMGERK